MKRFNRILAAVVAAGLMFLPFAGIADETRYQYDENFPYGTFSLNNFRASLRGLSQMDLMPLRPQAKRVIDGMEYTTTAAATAQYSGTGVTITAETAIKQEGDASLKAVIDATNDRTFSRTFSINLSAFKNITVWTRASSTSSAIQYFLSDGTNLSYWNITTDATANTWKQHTLILATPDANSGSPASLSAITSYGYRLLDNGVTYYFDTVKAIVGMTVAVRGTDLGSYYRNVYLGVSPLQMNMTASPTITAPTTNPRIDILLVDSSGTLSWVTGTEAASPSAPWSSVPTNKIPVCLVYNKTTETKILDYEDKDTDTNQGYILADVRPFLNLGSGWLQGADVASASAVTLGNDGNFFKITGTTTITSITIKSAGTRVALWFTGVLTVTNGSNLKLNGNFVTAADSTLYLVSDGTNWRELSRQPTASSFIKLSDVFSSYSGQAYKLTRVNSGETGIEAVSLSSIAENSVEENTGTRKFRLNGDIASPGNYKVYGTNSSGARGWYDDPFVPHGIDVITTSGIWSRPTGVTKVYVKVWGAGGSGGAGNTSQAGGEGGGGGGYAEGIINVSGNVTVTVGTTAGATSSFAGDTTIQATGGASSGASGGAGGVGSGGTLNLTGGSGGPSGTGDYTDNGGDGGSAPMGGGGGGGSNSTNYSGAAGAVPGGGGGGGCGGSGSSSSGGSFAAGLVIVYY